MSTTAKNFPVMTASKNELECLLQHDKSQIIKIMPHDEIKREQPMSPTRVDTHISETTSSNPYSRAQNNGSIPQGSNSSNFKTASNVQNQRSHTVIKYEKNILISVGQPAIKYINQNTSSRNLYSKSESNSHNAVQSSISRRRRSDKVGKGLRHFSMKVCEKVKEKGSTTYNEVADELVAEEVQSCEPFDSGNCDQKNIRRRVYDALNVLMAMNIILKDKKEIRWIGLPTNSLQQCNLIEKENQRRRERIDAKQKQLKELLLQQISFKSLVERNKEAERQGNIPTPNSSIQLPFIIVNTHKSAKVNCSVSADKSQYYFKFNEKFEIHDDVEVLKRMGFLLGLDNGNCSREDIQKARNLVPKNFEKYVEMYGRGEDEILSDDGDLGYIEMVEPILHTGDRLSDECHIEDEILTDHSDGE